MGAKGKACSLNELVIFLLALVAGTGYSLASKFMLEMTSFNSSDPPELRKFEKPLFQTLGMFVGMCAALIAHVVVVVFRIPYPGYKHPMGNKNDKKGYVALQDPPSDSDLEEEETVASLPIWLYFILIIPSLCDLIATALCMFGLLHLPVSLYQMLRGSAIIFVAILKHFVLKDKLRGFMWVGILWNCLSIALVGATAMLSYVPDPSDDAESKDPVFGIVLVLAGAFVQSLQYAFEEVVMSMDVSAPPLLLIGMEGFWGTLFTLFVLYPIAYNLPGNDVGNTIENPYDTLVMLQNSHDLRLMFLAYFCLVFLYNSLSILVTFMLSSVWHAILDNFRPITVWGVNLFIFYCVNSGFGERWTIWSYLQLLGMGILLYGTAIYNAPNPGSIKLTGGPTSCFCTFDYSTLEFDSDSTEVTSLLPGSDASTSPTDDKSNEERYTAYQSPYQSPFMTPSSANSSHLRKKMKAEERDIRGFRRNNRSSSIV